MRKVILLHARMIITGAICGVLLGFVTTTGCYRITMTGPNGTQTVTPFGGTMVVRVYNYCVPRLHAEGIDHMVDVPFGQSRELILPKLLGMGDNQPFSVVFTAYASGNEEMGVRMEQFYPDYNAYVTRKQYIVGGQYTHLYDANGRDACRQ